jgi:hypothetical protein
MSSLSSATGAEEKVILRKCSKAGGVTDEPMPKSALCEGNETAWKAKELSGIVR